MSLGQANMLLPKIDTAEVALSEAYFGDWGEFLRDCP